MTLKRPRTARCADISSASECFQYQLLEGAGGLLGGSARGWRRGTQCNCSRLGTFIVSSLNRHQPREDNELAACCPKRHFSYSNKNFPKR